MRRDLCIRDDPPPTDEVDGNDREHASGRGGTTPRETVQRTDARIARAAPAGSDAAVIGRPTTR